eukprot:9502608-Pyramimonas_sp.AAC.1
MIRELGEVEEPGVEATTEKGGHEVREQREPKRSSEHSLWAGAASVHPGSAEFHVGRGRTLLPCVLGDAHGGSGGQRRKVFNYADAVPPPLGGESTSEEIHERTMQPGMLVQLRQCCPPPVRRPHL